MAMRRHFPSRPNANLHRKPRSQRGHPRRNACALRHRRPLRPAIVHDNLLKQNPYGRRRRSLPIVLDDANPTKKCAGLTPGPVHCQSSPFHKVKSLQYLRMQIRETLRSQAHMDVPSICVCSASEFFSDNNYRLSNELELQPLQQKVNVPAKGNFCHCSQRIDIHEAYFESVLV